MRIAFVLTYPLYYDGVPMDQWLAQPCRERRLAGLVAAMGHRVEFWAVGRGEKKFVVSEENRDPFTVRVFKANRTGPRIKYDASDGLVDYARSFKADLHILKGVDGGAGTLLIRKYLKKERRDLAFILGGGYQSPYHGLSRFVFYESEVQKKRLMSPGWRFWQPKPVTGALIQLPKWVDDQVFGPRDLSKRWDILIIGRLVRGIKNYSVLGKLSQHFRVAVIGDGEDAPRLRASYPDVQWLGRIPNRQIADYINRAHLLMHTSLREFYPRVVAEALTCGVPCVAFAGPIGQDVIPADCGLLLDRKNFIGPLFQLLGDKERLQKMGQEALRHAQRHIGKEPCLTALEQMLSRLNREVK